MTDQDVAEVRAALKLYREKMPFLVSLNVKTRRQLPKLGEKTVGFDEKCAKYIATRPEFLPFFVSPEDMAKDRALRSQLQHVAAETTALAADVIDSLLTLGAGIYRGDLA